MSPPIRVGRKIVSSKVSKTGDNFLMLKVKLARTSRRRPIDPGPVPWVAATRWEGTEEHAIGRLNTEMLAMIQAKLTLEALGPHATTVFSPDAATVQRIFAGDLIGPLPQWLFDSKGKKLLQWAHQARCGILMGGVPLDRMAPVSLKTEIERTFGEVSGVTRAENVVDMNVDFIQQPRQMQIINSLGTTGSRLRFEQIVAGLQHMNRGEISALEIAGGGVEMALLDKGSKNEEQLLLMRDIVRQRLRFASECALPQTLTRALIEDQRELFLSAAGADDVD
jgi:hypothetical protein